MAEERLIDDDKDKKYRFRINANGEEELIVDDGDSPSDEGTEAELSFGDSDDDTSYAYDSEGENHYGINEEQERQAVGELLAKAEDDMGKDNFSTALEYVAQAREISPDDGDVAALELRIYTRNLTDFSPNVLNEAASVAERVAEYASAESKQKLKEMGAEGLERIISGLQSQADDLNERNESAKAERAVRFNADNKKSIIRMACTLVPFIVMLALAIYYSTIMYADAGGVNIILTIVFAALAFVCFFVCVFAARSLNITARRVRMNRDNSRTQLGRDYEAIKARITALRTIYDAITQ